jgi:radical SAM protein with 4Fe4S-binding SPASM domain
MELRSPCGGAIGQLAYYYDGKIFTCDEGRMLYEMGNDAFELGTVNDSYKDLMKSKITETMCKASCLECINKCENCAYMPYCGTCPVCNLANYDNIFVDSSEDERCKIYGGILDIIFDYIQDKEKLEIMERWL